MSEDVHKDTDRRVSRLESDLSNLTDKVINLSDLVVSTNTNVDNLVSQVTTLFNSTKPHPPNYSVWIAFTSLLFVIGAAVLTPLYSTDAEQKRFDITVMEHMKNQAWTEGVHETNIEWLKKMEDRSFQQSHGNQ